MNKKNYPMRLILISLIISFVWLKGSAQNDTIAEAPVKTGWTFGALPAIAYNSDEGFRYGALANFFYYGDGSTFPAYMHSLYFEWSRTTKGNGINNFFYDSPYLIPNTRATFDLNYLTEQALDFYGFNGYEAIYDMDREDQDQPGGSRMFYRYDRRLTRITADFQRNLPNPQWKWLYGTGFFGAKLAPVNFGKINRGLDEEDQAREVQTLYEIFTAEGVIPAELADGGNTVYLKTGLVHDTRDNIANPMRGMWTEAIMIGAPGFMGNGDYGYLQGIFIHRHYFTLVPNRLSLANRLGYQSVIAGNMPFYMQPFIYSSYKTQDGFGGAKTVRGIRRNRVQGEGIAYGNFELRYKAVRFNVGSQNFYISTSTFADFAKVTQRYKIDTANPAIRDYVNPEATRRPHWGTGLGLHIVMNENFIVAVNYGWALDKKDGDTGMYIGLNFLY
jgi:outer membrane protein assembly factor BamA